MKHKYLPLIEGFLQKLKAQLSAKQVSSESFDQLLSWMSASSFI